MILVTGGTGLAGSAVMRELVRHNAPVRALVRDPAKADVLRAAGNVEVVVGDMLRPETLAPALRGVTRALMISSADANLVEAQRTFIDSAHDAGASPGQALGDRARPRVAVRLWPGAR